MAGTNRDVKSSPPTFPLYPVEWGAPTVSTREPYLFTPVPAKKQAASRAWVLALPALIERLVETICARHAANNGSTVSLSEGEMVGRKLFAVCISPGRSVELTETPTRQNFLAFVVSNLDVLVQQGRCVGTWFDRSRNVHVLDIVICLSNRQAAITIGRIFGQTSIYDLFLRREIVIEPSMVYRIPLKRSLRKPLCGRNAKATLR